MAITTDNSGEFLKKEQSTIRISKGSVLCYYSEDVTKDSEGDYHILFILDKGVKVRWRFFSMEDRDAALANVDITMGTVDV
jgi:hypothetical protein